MTYNNLYTSLNERQKNAVDEIEGCVMVVAGPGTGKTQVLGARIASILQRTDTAPENILCLTFTEAATIALRKRLTKFIGSEAYRVNIYTYHGFCNTVIQENKDFFRITDLDPISELETEEVLREIIDELGNTNPIKRYVGDVYYDVGPLKKLFGLMKKDNLSSADVLSLADDALKEAVEGDEYRYKRKSGNYVKGDLKQHKIDELAKSLDKLKAAAQLLDVYNKKLQTKKRYDFNDMLSWVLEAFTNSEELLLTYQEKFQYVLVDEYQDTNGIQNDLLHKLISYWENPNVFVVGDDDQSIYKFQGANVENIFGFYKSYEKYIHLVVLDKNYRSSQNILDGSNTIIKHNQDRLVGQVPGLQKEIVAANEEVANITDALNIVSYPNSYQEVVSITSEIKKLKNNGVELGEVAVMYRNHSQSDDLIKYLEAESISYNVARSQDVLEVPIVDHLNTLLTYFAFEQKSLDSGQHLLFEILHYHNFKYLSAYEIAKMSSLFSKNYKKGWREHWNTSVSELDLSTESRQELNAFIQDIEYWLKELHNVTLQTLVERVMSKMGFVARALAAEDATFQIQCLKTYYNFLKEETAREPLLDVASFLQKIELLKKNNLGLKLTKVVHGENGVNLMTVHGSKGLEFEYVYLIGCTESKWEKDKKSLPYGLNKLLPGEPAKAIEEESRRLFYVALTRARKHIEVSYSNKNEKDKDQSKSMFVAELEESGAAQLIERVAQESELLNFFDFMVSTPNTEYKSLVEQDFVKKEVDNFRLSATNLNSYLKCPVTFFYQNIIRVPSAKSESMTFGTSIHYALDGLFKNLKDLKTDEEAKKLLQNRFEASMHTSREAFTAEGLERRLYYGVDILSNYYDQYKQSWQDDPQKVETELYLKNCEIDGVPIRGQIDKVAIDGTAVHVSDFKTGQFKYGKSKVSPPTVLEDNPEEEKFEKRYGGDYWRQILFYKALIESDKSSNLKVISGDIDFVEPFNDEFQKVKIMINDEDYQFVREQIKNTFAKIQNLEFSEGCEKEDCQWCQFNATDKRRYLV